MRMNAKRLFYIFWCFLVLSNSAFAAGFEFFSAITPGHFEVIGGLGGAQLDTGNSELGVTQSETDKLVQTNTNTWNTWVGQFGLGYIFYLGTTFRDFDQVQWFPFLEPELNLEQLSNNNITGDVWRFNSPAFNDLTFNTSLNSTRLMADAALTIASYKHFSIYAIGGIGSAWNRLKYSDTDNSGSGSGDTGGPCSDQRLSLNHNTSTHFAWETGVGLTYAFNNRIGLSVEYQYVNLGNATTSANGNTGTITKPVLVAAQFNNLTSQTVLAALHIAL
jgi:opacity protein-like surface antigen